jgi:hypothetical protein
MKKIIFVLATLWGCQQAQAQTQTTTTTDKKTGVVVTTTTRPLPTPAPEISLEEQIIGVEKQLIAAKQKPIRVQDGTVHKYELTLSQLKSELEAAKKQPAKIKSK